MSDKHHSDGVFAFALGLLAGIAGGAVIGVLVAPMNGLRLRIRLRNFLQSLPVRVEGELEPDSHTRQFIDRTRVKLENRVEQAQHNRHARRVAHAKEREESASGARD